MTSTRRCRSSRSSSGAENPPRHARRSVVGERSGGARGRGSGSDCRRRERCLLERREHLGSSDQTCGGPPFDTGAARRGGCSRANPGAADPVEACPARRRITHAPPRSIRPHARRAGARGGARADDARSTRGAVRRLDDARVAHLRPLRPLGFEPLTPLRPVQRGRKGVRMTLHAQRASTLPAP